MKRTLLLLLLTGISFSCSKSVAYCWACVDNAGNDLYNACDKTESQAKGEFVGRQSVNGRVLTEADFNSYCQKR